MDKKECENDVSTQKAALLGLLFKLDTVDSKSVKDPCNHPKAPGIITCVRDKRGT